jgi:hypothetical protein
MLKAEGMAQGAEGVKKLKAESSRLKAWRTEPGV